MGTTRLAIGFGAGLVGILFLVLAITPTVTGQVEIGPTSVSIDDLESGGFPDSQYLKVTDAYLVFSVPHLKMSGGKDGRGEFSRLTVPAVSASQLKAWQESLANDEKVDASQFRLFASFEADQVARLWPELETQAEAGQPLTPPPVQMTIVGDTEPAKFMVFKPYDIERRMQNFDWEQARWLRFERHFHSLGRIIKNVAIGLLLLAVSIVVFLYHRRVPDDVSQDVFDWSAVPGILDDTPDIDSFDADD